MIHWLLVSSPGNFETSRKRGFDLAGMKSRWKKAAGEVAAGDTVFFCLTKLKAIGGEATVTGPAEYMESPIIWHSSKDGETYPHRFPIKLVKARDEGDSLPVDDFLMQYEYAKRWPEDHRMLAFQGNVHRLDHADYELIHGLL